EAAEQRQEHEAHDQEARRGFDNVERFERQRAHRLAVDAVEERFVESDRDPLLKHQSDQQGHEREEIDAPQAGARVRDLLAAPPAASEGKEENQNEEEQERSDRPRQQWGGGDPLVELTQRPRGGAGRDQDEPDETSREAHQRGTVRSRGRLERSPRTARAKSMRESIGRRDGPVGRRTPAPPSAPRPERLVRALRLRGALDRLLFLQQR